METDKKPMGNAEEPIRNEIREQEVQQEKKRRRLGNAIFWWVLAAACLALVIWYVFWEGPRHDDTNDKTAAYTAAVNADSNLTDNDIEINQPSVAEEKDGSAVATLFAAENEANEAQADEACSPAAAATPVETAAPAPASAKVPVSTTTANIDELARKVIHGDYGDGAARRSKLSNLYPQVQQRVNYLLSHHS